ncbi:MAG: Dabb family protein [Flammeovirgaceae bacterium]|nr:Dabb family protein [Flammeovirgaceae bacterium]
MKQEIKMDQVLRHMVLFKFNDDAAQAEVQKISDAFKALPEAIPVIKDFEWGLNDSPENFDQGFTHCYLVTFESVQDRDSVYTPHPAHQAFVASLQPFLEKVFVVDYWTNP